MSSSLPLILRPAWRNFWHLIVLSVVIFVGACALLIASFVHDGVSDPVGRVGFIVGVLTSLGFVSLLIEKRYSMKFVVERTRLLEQYGIFSRRQQSINMANIRSVELEQNVIQRMFGVGDLAFYTSGSGDAEIRFHGILRPERIKAGVRRLSDMASSGSNGTQDEDNGTDET